MLCPRPMCQGATLKQEGSDLAICPTCDLAFCLNCRKTWHGVAPCKLFPEDLARLKKLYDNSSRDVQRSMERRYGKNDLINAFQEMERKRWIENNSQNCPNCHAHVEQIDGCNKMHCSFCNVHFCWLFGKRSQKQTHIPTFGPVLHVPVYYSIVR